MKILIGWDNAEQADLLKLYLDADGSEATIALTEEDLLAHAEEGAWDIFLMSLAFPKSVDQSFPIYQKVQERLPGVPAVVACRQTEMFSLPKFLRNGLRFHITRDDRGDFVFLLLASLESAVAATRAEESRKLANRLREEMDGVRRLQESIIPQGLKPPAGYRMASRYEPSQVSVVGDHPVVMAGGDYYDLFRPDDRTLIVLIGDAAGHGLKACMSIMTMHTLVRMFRGEHFRNTGAFVAEINQRLCENSIVQQGEGFITLFYAAIDTIDHTMSWTSAGHPPALLQLLETNEVVQVGDENDGGLPLGVAPGLEYTSAKFAIPDNSRILLYSDGLPDAFPLNGDARASFGVRGIKETLQANRGKEIEETLHCLFDASHQFAGGDGRHDDTSVVLLERYIE